MTIITGTIGSAPVDAGDGLRTVQRPDLPPAPVSGEPVLSHPAQQSALDRLIVRRSGLVLVAGLRGSRRSQTLRMLADRFAAAAAVGTRAEAATDPVLIDRIQDRRSADLAVQNALDDRVVLASIEAAGALAAIEAMRAMRQDDFAIASTLRLAIGQQSVERLCTGCRRPVQASSSISALLGFDLGAVVHEAPGCPRCSDRGTDGLMTVHELIEVDYPLRRLINGGGDTAILARHAFVRMPTMGSIARSLARSGTISAKEAVRVSRGEPLVSSPAD
ncbi:hypothetical protein ACPVPU_05160 [Sphingomonas sp. CJ99]